MDAADGADFVSDVAGDDEDAYGEWEAANAGESEAEPGMMPPPTPTPTPAPVAGPEYLELEG